eukprot:3730787-Amphidinium_carterae.1
MKANLSTVWWISLGWCTCIGSQKQSSCEEKSEVELDDTLPLSLGSEAARHANNMARLNPHGNAPLESIEQNLWKQSFVTKMQSVTHKLFFDPVPSCLHQLVTNNSLSQIASRIR